MKSYVAIDLETANADKDSVCEIGLARFVGGVFVSSWSSIVKPSRNPSVDVRNYSIHGISQEDIDNSREIGEVWAEIVDFIGPDALVAHNATQDLNKLFATLDASSSFISEAKILNLNFLCTLTAARKIILDTEDKRLETLCEHYGILYENVERNGVTAHTAEQDAIAAGMLLAIMLQRHGATDLTQFCEMVGLKLGEVENNGVSKGCVSKTENTKWGNSAPNAEEFEAIKVELEKDNKTIKDHPLKGQLVCMTLSLRRLSEAEVATACAITGAIFKSGVSSKLNFLIEGDDPTGKYKRGTTSKSRKVRELNESGSKIRVVDEEEFLSLLGEGALSRIDEIRGQG